MENYSVQLQTLDFFLQLLNTLPVSAEAYPVAQGVAPGLEKLLFPCPEFILLYLMLGTEFGKAFS